MALAGRYLFNFSKKIVFCQPFRLISVTPVNNLKEIIERKEGKTLILEAKIVQDPKEARLLKPNENGACPLCAAGIDVKHTDVLILSQFLRSDGCMLPRRVTGLCWIQQKRVETMVIMAHRAGLLKFPPFARKDPARRLGFNTWYDEDTIEWKYKAAEYRH
ncbi:28S ribosomal protein S18a, mitochondrial [Chelonus insularis]|uniref:28S ribosomal protein S18a, mitochondrial n=1 Tax=Chelonus insularis TaxID=460826 RepID=UPI00158A8393|nr:28S ribosomal protein S18a, mitochondrial [Chelonus insularis]